MSYSYISEAEAIERYEDMLNEVYGVVSIAGINFDTAHALKELDPIAFDVGLTDWLDSEELTTDETEA